MPQVPLPTGIVGDKDTPLLQESLVNLYNPGNNTLLKTPGNESFSTGEGACRGTVDFKEEHYQVSGTQLIKVNSAGVTTLIGLVEGTQDCVFDKTFNFLVIVVKGGKGYSLTNAGVFSEITSTNFRTSVDVCAINQRFVFIPSDGGVVFYTDVNTLVIDALNFFDAEVLPDLNKGCINLNNDLYIGGFDSFEVFRDEGDIDNPFLRVDGAAVQSGYIAAKARFKNTFVFLGRDIEGNFAFKIMSTGQAIRISVDPIDEILNNDYTLAELETVTSQRFSWNNTDMVAFRLPRETFLFYGTGWSRIQTGIDSALTNQPWDVKFLTFSYGKYITGSATGTNIGRLQPITTEFGDRIERQINTYIKAESNTYFTIDNFFLDCITGTNIVEGTIGLSISRDNQTFGPTIFRPLAPIGESQQQVTWYGGVGRFERFCGIRLRTTSDVNFSLSGLVFNG